MIGHRVRVVEAAVIERARRLLQISRATSHISRPVNGYAAPMADQIRESGGPGPSIGRRAWVRLGLTNYAGGISFRRTDRDAMPGHDITELILPSPAPGRPMPGASVEEIVAWNVKRVSETNL